jgi:hypothetical protein
MDEETNRAVRARAGERCEYCLLPESLHPGPFEVEQVIPVQHGWADVLVNLASACLHGNRLISRDAPLREGW